MAVARDVGWGCGVNVVRMAWRNVWRNTRRSAVTIAAMTLALVVEVLYSGLVDGIFRGMEDDVVELELGDLQITAPGYLEKPSLYTVIEDEAKLLTKLDALGYPASGRILAGALAAHGEFSSGVMLTGLDVARDARVTRISEHVVEGSWLDPSDPKGVVIGRRLAHTLAVGLGDEVVVLGQGADGSMANELYRVRGILGTVGSGTDRGTVFVVDRALRELLVLPGGVHRLVVRRPEDVPLEVAVASTRTAAPALVVKSWRDLVPIVAQMLDSMGGMVVVLYLIVYVAVGILILNAVLMAVFERIREFGVLKAIGVGPGQVFAMILLEGLIQAAVAAALGLVLAAPGMWFLSRFGLDVGAIGG